MSDDELRAAVRRFFEEVWNSGNVGGAEEFLAPQFVSLPDHHTTLEDVLVDGDRVAVRGTDRGTHRGEFLGVPASGRAITTTWIEIFRMEDGKAVEGWLESDSAELRDQLVGQVG